MKMCIAITGIHFLLVQVPTLFSKYFGDEVGTVSKKLGSEDQIELGLQLQKIKQRKEL